jgi:F0F1-type ATP synthase assembly protein I
MNKDKSREPGDKPALDALSGSSAGTDLAACIIVGLALGYLCQRFLPWSRPWGFLSFLFLGIAAGFYQLFKSQSAGRQGKK